MPRPFAARVMLGVDFPNTHMVLNGAHRRHPQMQHGTLWGFVVTCMCFASGIAIIFKFDPVAAPSCLHQHDPARPDPGFSNKDDAGCKEAVLAWMLTLQHCACRDSALAQPESRLLGVWQG